MPLPTEIQLLKLIWSALVNESMNFRFGLERHLLTPITRPTNDADVRYVQRCSLPNAQLIERTFGLTKHRFRCMHRSGGDMTYDPVKCWKISVTCMILNNMCISANLTVDDDVELEWNMTCKCTTKCLITCHMV